MKQKTTRMSQVARTVALVAAVLVLGGARLVLAAGTAPEPPPAPPPPAPPAASASSAPPATPPPGTAPPPAPAPAPGAAPAASAAAPAPGPAPADASPASAAGSDGVAPGEIPGDTAPAAHLRAAREAVPLRAPPPGPLAPSGGSAGGGGAAPTRAAGPSAAAGGRATDSAGRSAAVPVAGAAAHEAITEAAEGGNESARDDSAAAVAGEEGKGEAAPKSGREFIKGELIYPGTRRLLSRFDHVGVNLGPDIIANEVFATVDPGMAWYFDNGISVSAHLPLRLLALEAGDITKPSFGGLKVRREDWDEISDYAKVIRFLTYGRKESNLYFTINTMRPASIGHGMLLNRYQGDIDVDRSLTGLMFDAYNRYGGFELQANDITFQNRLLGGLAFVKPLSLLSDSPYAEGLSLGFEAVADLLAPRCVRFSAASDACVRGSDQHAGTDPYTGETLDQTFVRTDPDTGRFAVTETTVSAIGVSAEAKVYKDERNVDIKLYGGWHRFTNEGGGDGLSGGVLARLNAGEEWINAFRIRAEYRTFTDGFLPSYFDSLYEIQKYSYLPEARQFQVTPTKYQSVFGDPQNGFARPEVGRRHGYDVEASWGLFHEKRSAKQVAFGFGIQDSTGPYDTSAYVHLEAPVLGWLQIFGTIMRTNADGLGDVFSSKLWPSENTVVLTGMRLEVLPILFINAHYSRSFRPVQSAGTEYHLGNDTIVDASGNPSPYFGTGRLFENVQTLFVQVELGWEFDDE